MTVDIPGAFMQADIDENLHIRLTGSMVKLLASVNPNYKPYIAIEGKQEVLYLKLKKALYGTVQAAYLFWKHLTGSLEE